MPRVWWRHFGVSLNRLNEIVLGKRGITADTALRLARFLKTSPQLWMRLQADWDLHQALQRQAKRHRKCFSLFVLYLILRFLVDLADLSGSEQA